VNCFVVSSRLETLRRECRNSRGGEKAKTDECVETTTTTTSAGDGAAHGEESQGEEEQ